MQDLIVEMLWHNTEIDEVADRLRQALPGAREAEEAYHALAEQVRQIVGYELYDRYFSQLMRYTGHEVQAYYSLGLGLRQDIVQALGVQG